MKNALFLFLLIPAILNAQGASEKDVWQPLKFLKGKWEGQGDGMSGTSVVSQEYKFILNGNFLEMRTKAVFEPQEKNPEGEVHEDFGVFSYDQFRKIFVLRSFYVEGFVNQYIHESVSEDGMTLTFVSELIENAPAGTKAKLIFKRIDDDTIEQSFHVAFPGQEYGCLSVNTLKRKS
jgi:hypothetical protein